MPHAAWMNSFTDSAMDEIITITARDTQKVKNLQENPRAEWMFASRSMETLIYLSGPTEILFDGDAQLYWDKMPGKYHAYYWHYVNSDDYRDFVVIRTRVEKVVYCRPQGYHKTVVFGPGA